MFFIDLFLDPLEDFEKLVATGTSFFDKLLPKDRPGRRFFWNEVSNIIRARSRNYVYNDFGASFLCPFAWYFDWC